MKLFKSSQKATRVVRLRRRGGEVVQDCDVYIGRRLFMGGWRLQPSEWANPYTVKAEGTAARACERFEQWLVTERPDLLARLGELRGKVLGCWCKPGPCHGDVLARLADEQGQGEVDGAEVTAPPEQVAGKTGTE
jgi:hypothetical protein